MLQEKSQMQAHPNFARVASAKLRHRNKPYGCLQSKKIHIEQNISLPV
jgi:hypothetical protein